MGKDLLDIELIEAVGMLTVLAEKAQLHLHEAQESQERWRMKNRHMRTMKYLSEAIEIMAINPEIHTIKQWYLDYENKRGAEWCERWGEWLWNDVVQSIMYAANVMQGISI